MVATGTNPTPGTESRHSDGKRGSQRCRCKAIEYVGLSQQSVIVDERSDPQSDKAGQYPNSLLPPRLGEVRVARGAVDLQNAQRANGAHQDQHQPVEVAKRTMSRHIRDSPTR